MEDYRRPFAWQQRPSSRAPVAAARHTRNVAQILAAVAGRISRVTGPRRAVAGRTKGVVAMQKGVAWQQDGGACGV